MVSCDPGAAAVHPIGIDRALSGVTEAQQQVHAAIEQGPRGSVPSPFLAMMDVPALADAVQRVGVVLRFEGVLSDAERELAILATAGAVGCGYEWHYHAPIAAAAGLDADTIASTRPGGTDVPAERRWALIQKLCREATSRRRVEAALLDSAIAEFGRDGVTELVAISGYYALLASFILIGGHDREF